MPTVHCPRNCSLHALSQEIGAAGALGSDWDALVVHFPAGCFVHCSAMAFLGTWGRLQVLAGRRMLLRGDGDALRYLARMDLHEHLGAAYDASRRQSDVGRFLPLRLIAGDDDVFGTVNAICDLVLHQFENAREFIPALEWAVNEIIDNILIHAESQVPRAVCAQYFPHEHRLDVGICDVGRGIKASLSESRHIWSHGDAVTTALQRGVTRNPDIGAGNGMAGALEIATQNQGGLQVWTGDVVYRLENGREKSFAQMAAVPGTGVLFSLDTRKPVDLTETWIAANHGWSYINAEAERIGEQGLSVAANCSNTGTRAPAERLRRKILALLPEITGPLVLDFTAVRSAASSFLDELLGKLAQELGAEAFRERIRAVGMNDMLEQMANVVLRQRLEPGSVDYGNAPEG